MCQKLVSALTVTPTGLIPLVAGDICKLNFDIGDGVDAVEFTKYGTTTGHHPGHDEGR